MKSAIPVENQRSAEIVPEFSVAVRKRAHIKREVQSIRPFKVTMVDELNITTDEFKKLQEEDEKLQGCWEKARGEPTVEVISAI